MIRRKHRLPSKYAVVPTIPEDYSSQGLVQVNRTIEAAQQRNPQLSVLGYLLTMVQPRLTVHQAFEIELREAYGEGIFETIIKAEKMHKEAIMNRKPLVCYKPRCAAAKTYERLAEEIATRIQQSTRKEAA